MRQVAGQRLRIVLFFAAVAVAWAGGKAAQAAQYAAIVMDMRDGSVLYEHNADQRLHPASLTKMMTLYLAFEAVENGQLSLDQKVRVSRNAARQPPSKLYLKEGQRVDIRSLIRAAAIKSANDAAVALADAIAGSERDFARLMTAKAQQLGMRNTTFRNANGLTERGHLSTVRDMAILARHLYFDFPAYYNLFSRRSDYAAGKRIWNTNRLLSTYRGADGIKTGYTRAAGYNLAASARRGSEHIIAVVFGGPSSNWRNARVAELLDRGFARAQTHVAAVPPALGGVTLASAPVPPARPGMPASGLEMLAQVIAAKAEAAVPPPSSPLAPLYSAAPPARPGADVAGGIPLPEPRPGWSIELGRFEDRAMAVARVTEVTLGKVETLADAAPEIEVVRGRTGTPLYRVRFIGLEPSYASRACQTLRAAGRDCVTLPPDT
jgi:D-alanyl-D-alanine carboxypeptidase